MDTIPAFDTLNETVSAECEAAQQRIDFSSKEWLAIERYLSAKKWQIAIGLTRGGPPEATEHARGRAAMLSELLMLRGQTNTKG